MQVMNGPYNYTRGTLSGQHTREKWYTWLLAHIFYRTSTMLDLANAKFAFLDLETTGLEPARDHILSIGFVPVDGLRIVQLSDVHCGPYMPRPYLSWLARRASAESPDARRTVMPPPF